MNREGIRVHLVDGTYELFRNHFGAPARSGRDGGPVGATGGLIRTLIALLREKETTHVAVAFDHVIESFRNDLFEGYKTGEGIDPDLFGQFPLAERATRALGIVVWPMVEFEADDALATAAHRFGAEKSVGRILLCSPDKDLAQCVSGDRIVCLDRRRKIILDEAGVQARFGVSPRSIPDWLALVGDDADGIPGIPGWGRKSAAKILERYGRLEEIPERAEEWTVRISGALRLAAALRDRRDDALLYRRLATLRVDVPIAEDLAALEWTGARRDELEALCEELGDPRLAERLPDISPRAAAARAAEARKG